MFRRYFIQSITFPPFLLRSFLFLWFLCLFILQASSLSAEATIGLYTFDHDHPVWNRILSRSLVPKGEGTRVRYQELKDNPEELELYLNLLRDVTDEEYEAFTEAQKLSFLINAYNAFTIKLIVDNYPIESIKKLGTLFASPWKKEFFVLFGKKRNLDYIEHERIRKEFQEPRIHFALVCAAVSCPPLRREAYRASVLESQLEDAAVRFLNDPTRNYYRVKSQTFFLSSLFKWSGSDFDKLYGSAVKYVLPRMRGHTYISVDEEPPPIQYLPYDWALNVAE